MDALLRLAKVLASPTRLAIFRSLREGASVTGTATRFGLAPSTASKHLEALRRAGLVGDRWRGREHIFEWRGDRRVGIVVYKPAMSPSEGEGAETP